MKDSLIFIITGMAFWIPGLWSVIRQKRFFKKNIVTQGIITTYRSQQDKGARMYSAVVSYEVDGIPHQVQSNVWTTGRPKLGDIKKIAFNPANPKEAMCEDSCFMEYVAIIIGAGLTAAGIYRLF